MSDGDFVNARSRYFEVVIFSIVRNEDQAGMLGQLETDLMSAVEFGQSPAGILMPFHSLRSCAIRKERGRRRSVAPKKGAGAKAGVPNFRFCTLLGLTGSPFSALLNVCFSSADYEIS